MKTSINYFFGLCILAVSVVDAHSEAGDWFVTDGARIRLITAPSPDGKQIDAGLQFELEKGWKTYWRAPGGSGLPPQVHFLGSKNVRSAIMQLPVPKEFNDESGKSVGYKNHVVFPITVTPQTPGQAVTLKATGIVGVCAEICVPVQFQLSAKETGSSGTQIDVARALNQAKLRLPVAAHDGQGIIEARTVNTKPTSIAISANVPAGAEELSLFVEGPSNWYVNTAALKSRKENTATFNLVLHDVPKDTKPEGTRLRFTLVADGKGTDQTIEIAPAKTP